LKFSPRDLSRRKKGKKQEAIAVEKMATIQVTM
jgi:hypothetical protein